MSAPTGGAGTELPNCVLIRATDQLELVLRGRAMRIEDSATGAVLRPTGPDAKLAVTLGPQHTMEPVPATSVKGDRAVFGGGTTLVFAVPPTTAPIPFTVDGILAALRSLPLHVDASAGSVGPLPVPAAPVPAGAALSGVGEEGRGRGTGAWAERVRRAETAAGPDDEPDGDPDDGTSRQPVADPEPTDAAPIPAGALPPGTTTQLRLPSRLRLTPRAGSMAFVHSARPATTDGRTELWHTRLARRRTDGHPVEVRAKLKVLGTDEQTISTASDQRLWNGTFTRTFREALVGRSLWADHLRLSGLGAWADLSYDSSDVGYVHRLVQGRDVMLRLKQRGTLYPLGHTAVLTSTIRRVLPPDNGRTSTMESWSVVTVVEPTRTYSASTHAGRAFPWQSVRLPETTTPPGTPQSFGGVGVRLLVDGAVHEFGCVGVDRGGRGSTFSMPLVFVPETASSTAQAAVQAAYQALPEAARTVSLGGRTLTVAEPSAQAPEATDVVADTVLLMMDGERPTVTRIVGKLPSLQEFAPALGDAARVITYASTFREHGLATAQNAGQLVLEIAGAAPLLDLADPALTGALVSPKFTVNAISRLAGPDGGTLADLAAGSVPLKDLIGPVLGDLTLFGAFTLADLLGPDLRFDLTGTRPELPAVPKLVTDALDGVSLPRLRWESPLFTGPAKEVPALPPAIPTGPVTATLSPIAGTTARLVLDMRTELEQPVVPTAPVVHQHTECRVENVALTLGLAGEPLVRVGLTHIRFATTDGRKPDVDVDLAPVEFFGVLAFVRSLAELVPRNGFRDPPALDIRPDGITSAFALPLPAVAFGVFSLENISSAPGSISTTPGHRSCR
jgi:hypothetical protein